jgi:hypothetical protein
LSITGVKITDTKPTKEQLQKQLNAIAKQQTKQK